MRNMEEKISQEAIELVRHAMSLLDLKLYDDAIEILRKAIRLYQQINNEEELNSLRKKIAEIYTQKGAPRTVGFTVAYDF